MGRLYSLAAKSLPANFAGFLAFHFPLTGTDSCNWPGWAAQPRSRRETVSPERRRSGSRERGPPGALASLCSLGSFRSLSSAASPMHLQAGVAVDAEAFAVGQHRGVVFKPGRVRPLPTRQVAQRRGRKDPAAAMKHVVAGVPKSVAAVAPWSRVVASRRGSVARQATARDSARSESRGIVLDSFFGIRGGWARTRIGCSKRRRGSSTELTKQHRLNDRLIRCMATIAQASDVALGTLCCVVEPRSLESDASFAL